MSYTINAHEPFFAGVSRVADSQVKKGLESLPQPSDPEEAIHDIRKRCKKIRAAWRLVRDDLGDKEYQKRNRYYRDTARILSDLRDATATLETLEMLKDRFGDVIYKSAFQEVQAALKDRRDQILPDPGQQEKLFKQVQQRLEKGHKKVNPLTGSPKNWKNTIKSLRRTYARARDWQRTLRKKPTAGGIHQWRKRTKYLRYQLRLLKEVWKPMINPWRKELNKLSDLQGDHHDLHELKPVLRSLKGVSEESRRALLGLAAQHQQYCFSMAMPLGERLYAEKPKAFAKRLRVYLNNWEAEPGEPLSVRVAF
jgi:CHAD domain-containing protein